MGTTAVPDRKTMRTHAARCGAPACATIMYFEFDDEELDDLPSGRSLTARATCPRCDDPQHLIVWSDGELSGPWLELT